MEDHVIYPVDAHVHVYSSGAPPFPFVTSKPPPSLATASADRLFSLMSEAQVAGALIVQPINFKFDHSYVASVLADGRFEGRFRGMCLLDPHAGDDYLVKLKQQGFGSVRFNPYLFDEQPEVAQEEVTDEVLENNTDENDDEVIDNDGKERENQKNVVGQVATTQKNCDDEVDDATVTTASSSSPSSSLSSRTTSASASSTATASTSQPSKPIVTMGGTRAIELFKQAGQLRMAVGFMCFKGLRHHFKDIVTLITASPDTNVIIDHWGFLKQNGTIEQESLDLLVSLAEFPIGSGQRSNVFVKLSAMFRNSLQPWPHADLVPIMQRLVKAFGAQRLIWATDYPWMCDYYRDGDDDDDDDTEGYATKAFVNEPLLQQCLKTKAERHAVLRGTAERLFGAWPATPCPREEDMLD